MSLMFEYKPGMSLTDPWPFTVVRASTAYRITKTGTLQQVAANVLRDNHYPFGLGSAIRTTLFEPTTINSLLQSQALATTWTPTAITATNNSAAAPDGTNTATLLVPSVANSLHYVQQGVTITANEFLAGGIFLKAKEYSGFALVVSDGTVTNGFRLGIDLSTGALNIATRNFGTGTYTGASVVPLAGGWYWIGVWGAIGSGVTAAVMFCEAFNTGANANTQSAFAGDGTSGLYAWGAQLERNGTVAPKAASSYVPTIAGTASRADEYAVTPWPYQTQPGWGYTAFYDLGGSIWLQSAPLVTITGSVVNTDPTWCPMFLRVTGLPGASYGSGVGAAGLLGSNRNTVGASASVGAVQPYDFVETFSRVLKDGSTLFEARRNGGAAFTSGPVGPAGGTPFADIVNPLLYLGRPLAGTGPQVGATCIRIGADPTRITTLALAAAA